MSSSEQESSDGEASLPERVDVVEINPNFFHLKALPLNVNVRTDEGLGYGEIYFFSYHLTAMDLPFHPLIYYFLYRTNLCAMQLHLNVFHILSCALSINDQYNWEIGLGGIFCCDRLISYQKGKDLYTLSPNEYGGSFLMQHKTIEKGWKDHAMLISGERLCSDPQSLLIK